MLAPMTEPVAHSTYVRRRWAAGGILLLVVAFVAVIVIAAVGSSSASLAPGKRLALASRYDGYGQPLACGGTLTRHTQGVANKTLPCGTDVTITYRGKTVQVPVIDRGPYVGQREFDLAGPTANALGFQGVQWVRVTP
jgi:rare lipoprotein A (peptidoglycan hydrolase)